MKKLLVGLVMVAVGCGPQVRSGTVVEKWYEPANTQIILMPMPCGKSTCLIPMPIYDDEDWMFTLEDATGEAQTDWETDRVTWESLVVGQRYQVPDDARLVSA